MECLVVVGVLLGAGVGEESKEVFETESLLS